jgi:hypothetical protein
VEDGTVHNERMPDDMLLSEAQMRDIIERASRELPASTGITVAELRQIAAELDIDAKSLERAFDEVVGLPIADQPVRTWIRRKLTTLGRLVDPFLPKKGRFVAGALFGGLAGWLNAFLMGFSLNGHYPIACAMIGITLANLLSRRLDRDRSRYVAETLAMWGLYGASWALTYGDVTGNLVQWVLLWTSLALLGGWRLLRAPSGGNDQPPLVPLSADKSTRAPADDPGAMPRNRIHRARIAWSYALRLRQA